MCLEIHICLQIYLRQIVRRIYTARSMNSIIFLYSTSFGNLMHVYLDIDTLVKSGFCLWGQKRYDLSLLTEHGGNEWSFPLVQNSFSALVLLKFGAGQFFIEGGESWPVPCRKFSSISGLYPLNANRPPPPHPSCDNQKMSPLRQNYP